ncbi:hypothetical protein E1B28_005078 [Marasmius oreades]|uniref:AB hydrolase-1 domain-containing protein n=1 Tax=Marasmius oreades TaxID=181124 RepID=A0A9P7V010_9AGAR|nr:uncharacterized protein E1B28_005078 [Marasmius oreades]KAG7097757.1 hypothetical protein E1B28_005078 [Marasmius oreades]
MAFRILSSLILLSLGAAVSTSAIVLEEQPLRVEGTLSVPFKVNGTVYKTWVFQHASPAVLPTARPLVVLHGGPGLTHDYMLPLTDLAASRPVVLYDQIGSGKSSHVASNDSTFNWGLDVFLQELDNVLSILNIGHDFDLLGHSWGGVMAAEYAVRRKNPGLKHLVFSDSLPSNELWDQSEGELLAAFPEEVQSDLAVGFDDPVRYRKGLAAFFAVHGCTVNPTPQGVNVSFDYLFEDPTSSIKMGAALTGWSIIDRLSQITVPTLVLNGAADISQDFVNQPYLDRIPRVTHYKFEKSSHTPMWEERDEYMQVVGRFLG